MDPVRQYTGQQVDGPLSLIVYPGANGAFRLYQDDGESFDFHHGVYTQIDMQWNNGTRQLLLSLAQGSRPPGHGRLPIEVRVAGETAAKNVSFDGRPLKVSL
jgi:alpha-D-xyloside xylohydrolase